jgi:hypothetical protein
MAQASDYTKLIPSENGDKPKFTAMVEAVAGCWADENNTLKAIESAFDLDQAQGAQLDIIGQWVGLSRNVPTPLTGVYFSFDTSGLGFDQGVIKGPYDPDDGITQLGDDVYRLMLRGKIVANHWDGTMPGYRLAMQTAFDPLGVRVVATDNQDMTMDVYMFGAVFPAVVTALLQGGYFPLKPAGVKINDYHVQPIFGFDINNLYIAGFDTGYFATQPI